MKDDSVRSPQSAATAVPDGVGSPQSAATAVPDGVGTPQSAATAVPDGVGTPQSAATAVPDGVGTPPHARAVAPGVLGKLRLGTRGRFAITVTSLIVCVLLATGIRVVRQGRAELARGEAAFDRRDTKAAILHGRRAAASYLPTADHVSSAYALLTRIAKDAEGRRDYLVALHAWRAMRSAAIESRSVWLPLSSQRAVAESAISRLIAAGVDPGAGVRASSLEAGESEMAWLATDPPPSRAPIVIRFAALFALVVACLMGRGRHPLATGWLGNQRILLCVGASACAWIASFWFTS